MSRAYQYGYAFQTSFIHHLQIKKPISASSLELGLMEWKKKE